jgi:hypothetical protein
LDCNCEAWVKGTFAVTDSIAKVTAQQQQCDSGSNITKENLAAST